MRPAGDPAQVKSLITSIKQYKGFRNMAQYNISCLMSFITPPVVGWQNNIQTAIEVGGIESIIDLLKQHPDALEMLKGAMDALSGLTVNSNNAGLVAKAGGVEAALQAMLGVAETSPEAEEVADSGAKLLEKVAQYNPQAVLDSRNGVDAVLDGLTHTKNQRVKAACANVADRVAYSDRGQKEVLKKGGIEALIKAIAPGTENTEEVLKPVFRLLEKFADDPANVKKIRDLNGVEALVHQLEAHADNEQLLRMGGRLLAKVAGDDLESAIERLKRGGLTDGAREFLTGLLANLALQPDNIDRIVAQGGVKVLIQNFDQFNEKTQIGAARALGRIATNKDNAAEIIREGGVRVLTNALKNNPDNEDLVVACSQALANIATSSLENANQVHAQGGIAAVVNSMKNHPEFEQNAQIGTKMIEQLANLGFDVPKLVEMGSVEAILAAMEANINSAMVQRNGFRALSALMKNDTSGKKSGPKTPSVAILSHKAGIKTMVTALEVHRSRDIVVGPALETFATLISAEKTAAAQLIKADVITSVVSAVYTQILAAALGSIQSQGAMDGKFEQNVRIIVSSLVNKKDAAGRVKLISNNAGGMLQGNENAAENLEATLQAVTVFAKDPESVNSMTSAGLANTLLGTFGDVSIRDGLPLQSSVMAAYALSIASVARASSNHLNGLSSGTKLLIDCIKKHTKSVESTICCMRALRVFATAAAVRERIVDEGCVESCVGGMRSNNDNPMVALAALDVFLSLASSDSTCAAVAFKGGSRQAIKMILDNSSSSEFERPTERALMVLERVANSKSSNEEIRSNLVKQNAVESVTKAMEMYPDNEVIESIGARLLSRLLDAAGVEAAIEKMAALVAELDTSKKLDQTLTRLAGAMATVGALSLAPSNVEIIQRKNAAGIIVDGLTKIGKLPLSKEREHARRAGFRALGQIASTCSINEKQLGLIDLIMSHLKAPESKVTLLEKMGVLNCVKSMASNEGLAKSLINAGIVELIIGLLKEHAHDEPFATAALGALGALCELEAGAKKATSNGLVKLTMGMMKNSADTCGPRFSEEAMITLSNLGLIDKNVAEMMEGGVIDLVVSTLDHHCADPASPEPKVLTAAVQLLQRLANSQKNIKNLVRKGAVQKVIEIANSSVVYQSDPECMEAIMFLLQSCAMVEDTHETLVKAGAVDLIMSAMNLNGTNENIVLSGSKALQTLLGSSGDTVKVLLNDISKLASQLKKKPGDRETQAALTTALRNLANLTLVDGVVNAKTAGDVAKTAVDAMNTIQSVMPDGPAKSELLQAAMQIIGRAALIPNHKIDMDKAVKSLLAIIAANPNDDMVLEAAMYALGNLATSPDAVKIIAANDGIALLEKTINEAAENERLREAAKRALDKVRIAAVENASSLAKDKAGANALAQLAIALGSNPTALRDMLNEIAAGKNGVNDLLAILGADAFKNAPPQVRDEVLRALRKRMEKGGADFKVTSAADMAGLLAAFDEKTDGLNKADKQAVLDRQKEALRLLNFMNAGSAAAFAAAGGVSKLLELLNNNMEDEEMVENILRTLKEMASDKNVVNDLVKGDAAAAIMKAMKQHPDNEQIQSEAIQLLAKMAAAKGVGKVGMDAEMMRLLNRTVEQFGHNRDIQKHGGKLIDGLSQIYKEDGADMIASRLDAAVLKLNAANHIKELYDENGKPYYYNTQTKQTSWTKPSEYADELAAFEALNKLTSAHKDNMVVVDPKALAAAVDFMKNHANEPQRLTALAHTLGALAANEENRNAIAKAGGLEAIIQALNGDHVDPAFLAAAIQLLNQFARNDYFKDQICDLGGIEALILIMLKFIAHLEVVEKCMSTLANLAFNSKKNMAEIMKYDGPSAVQKCMKKYNQEAGLLHFALILLSNLMYGNDDNKLIIGKVCGDEIVDVCRQHHSDPKLFKGSLRAMGNLSYCDENILWIVGKQATKWIVQGMTANENDLESQQIAIDVIGNFASFDEDDDAIKRKIERGEQASVYEMIMVEGGAKRILDTVKNTDEPALMNSGLEALSNLAHNHLVTERLIHMGIVGTVFYAMQKYDWDESLLEKCVRLVAIITYSDEGVKAIGEHDGVQILLNAMESHEDQPDFLANACAALKNIASNDTLRNQIGSMGGVKTVLGLYEKNMDAQNFLLEAITLFIRLTRDDELSEQIAKQGMNLILESIGVYKDDTSFLVPIFTLIGHLAFNEANLKVIVQYGGIDLIIDSILSHPESKNLVIRSIQTIDNVAMHSPEHSKIVIEAGGQQTIEEVISAYTGDKEVVQVGKSALLSMQPQVQRRKAKPKYAFAREEAAGPSNVDPLKDYRNMLRTGIVVTEWSSPGNGAARHLYVKPDLKHVCWRDPKKPKHETMINLRDMRNVRSGLHDGHKRGRRQAKAELAFSIVGRATTIDLEARTQEDREKWVDALQVLIRTYKTDPKWLK